MPLAFNHIIILTDSQYVESLGLATMSLMCNINITCEVNVAQVITLKKTGTSSAGISPNAFEVASISGSAIRRVGHRWCSDDKFQRQTLIRWPLALGVNLSGFRRLLCCDTTCRVGQCLIKLRPATLKWTEPKQITFGMILNLSPSVPARKSL